MTQRRTEASRLAIGHDWLISSRGAERLLTEFCLERDDLQIHTLFFDPDAVNLEIRRQSIYVSPLNRLPAIGTHYRLLLPVLPRAAENMAVEDADVLLTISHSVAKGFRPVPGTPHVCYCLSPMRYLWEPALYGQALDGSIRGRLLGQIAPWLKAWDLETNQRVDHFVAISATVQERVRRHYGRDSDVIHPCVDLDFFQPDGSRRGDFYLVVSALVPQKRLELAVEAFNRNGCRLLVAGSGPSRLGLERAARENVEFLGWRSDLEIRRLYRTARALVFPGTEDFGLVPVEAQACGCPVIAFRNGGATETVVDHQTGVFFDEDSPESLINAIEAFQRTLFDPNQIRENAERFSRERFQSQWRDLFARLNLRIFG